MSESEIQETYFIGWWAAHSINAGTGALNNAFRELAHRAFMAGYKCAEVEPIIDKSGPLPHR